MLVEKVQSVRSVVHKYKAMFRTKNQSEKGARAARRGTIVITCSYDVIEKTQLGKFRRIQPTAKDSNGGGDFYVCMVIPEALQNSDLRLFLQTVDNSVTEFGPVEGHWHGLLIRTENNSKRVWK